MTAAGAITRAEPTRRAETPPAEKSPRAEHDAVTLTLRRVYILPTRHGFAFAAVLVVMLLGAANYNNSLGYVLTFLLGSLALLSVLYTYRNLAHLVVLAGQVKKSVFVGGRARFELSLDNRGGALRPTICASYGRWRGHKGTEPGAVYTSVPADSLHRIELTVPAAERGWLELGRVALATRYPLGLFRAWSHIDLPLRCLVYPRPAANRELPPNAVEGRRDGAAGGRGREDFAGFRDYVPGDSPRQIHWKAAARGQGMPVKLFSGMSSGELVLNFDDAPDHGVESRLSQLCRWVLEAEKSGYRYALALPRTVIEPGSGDAHQRRCLEALAVFGQGK